MVWGFWVQGRGCGLLFDLTRVPNMGVCVSLEVFLFISVLIFSFMHVYVGIYVGIASARLSNVPYRGAGTPRVSFLGLSLEGFMFIGWAAGYESSTWRCYQ